MKIEKLASGKYRIRKKHKGVVYIINFDKKPTEKEALLAVAKKLEEAESCDKGSFMSFAEKYIAGRKNVVSPSTVRTYQIKLNQLSEGFTKKNLVDLSNDDIQAEISLLAGKYEPKTVKTTYGFIASIFGLYRPNYKLKIKLPQQVRKDEYEPNTDDIKRILEAVKGTPYSVAFQLGVFGCRRGEICALSFEDLDGDNLRIHRTMVYDENGEWVVKDSPKTDESNRILALPKPLADKIREQGYIYKGHPNALNKALHRIQKKLDIPAFKFHALRSYFASYAHSLGIPDADIMAIGGWKTPYVMNKVYRKSLENSRLESMKKLSNGIFS